MSFPIYDQDDRRIYAVECGFVIAEGGSWIPGCYADLDTAKAAFDLDDAVLAALQAEVNRSEVDPARRIITATMLRGAPQPPDPNRQ